MKVYAGMDIGGTKVALGVFGEDKTLLGKTKYPSDASLSAEEFFQQAAAQNQTVNIVSETRANG